MLVTGSVERQFVRAETKTATRPRTTRSVSQVTRQDVAIARDEGWWGKSITVNQEQIIQQ